MTLCAHSSATVLNGLKGDLLLDADGKVLTFVPVVSSTTGAAVEQRGGYSPGG